MIESGAAKISEGFITPEALDDWKQRVGIQLRVGNVFNQYASKEAIRNYVLGIGDVNPLWLDEDYAKKTRYKNVVAPPNWLYSVFPTWVLQGLPGVHAFHSGNEWTFLKPVFYGDTITPESTFTGFDVKPSRFAGKMVREYQRARFVNQRGELVAYTDLWLVRAERAAARSTGKYHKLQLPHPWTEEELKKVDQDVLSEQIRGSNPRFWEDVNVGDKLHPVVKGVFGLMDMIAYTVGAAPVQVMAHRASLELYNRHPAWALRDPNTYAWEPVYAVHFNKAVANAAGVPYPYSAGAQNQSWAINLITNWMGDDGWLKKNYAEYRHFVYLSDALYLTGEVVRKYIDGDGEYCVDIKTRGVNQRGEDAIPGFSTVALPSRDNNVCPVDKRLPKRRARRR